MYLNRSRRESCYFTVVVCTQLVEQLPILIGRTVHPGQSHECFHRGLASMPTLLGIRKGKGQELMVLRQHKALKVREGALTRSHIAIDWKETEGTGGGQAVSISTRSGRRRPRNWMVVIEKTQGVTAAVEKRFRLKKRKKGKNEFKRLAATGVNRWRVHLSSVRGVFFWDSGTRHVFTELGKLR